MFVNGMYLSVFCCLCYEIVVSTDHLDQLVSEEIDPDLNEEQDTRIYTIREEHQRDVYEEGDDKKKIHAPRWGVYVEDKEDFIKIHFSESVPHPKGKNIVWTCGNDHIIDEKEQHKYIGLRGFD